MLKVWSSLGRKFVLDRYGNPRGGLNRVKLNFLKNMLNLN